MDRQWDTGLEFHEPLQDFTIKMFGKRYKLQPAADLEFHPSTLGEDLQKQPSLYAFYATVQSMAQSKVTALNARLEQKRSELDSEYRTDGCLPGGHKITEDGLRRAIRSHPDSIAIQDLVHKAELEVMMLVNIVRAFEHRRDCLIALAHRANNNTFNDGDVNVTVAASITTLIPAAARSAGQHPSKKQK